MTPTSTDPEIVMEILAWCQARQPGRAARLTRSRALFPHFADLLPPSIITVAGTAGKGTTCALLSAILREAGYTVGVYTKPHLREFRERTDTALSANLGTLEVLGSFAWRGHAARIL
jgi:folylpolyglutamate synthase/dihydropteroate synthase